jgi:hypothetical protein
MLNTIEMLGPISSHHTSLVIQGMYIPDTEYMGFGIR